MLYLVDTPFTSYTQEIIIIVQKLIDACFASRIQERYFLLLILNVWYIFYFPYPRMKNYSSISISFPYHSAL